MRQHQILTVAVGFILAGCQPDQPAVSEISAHRHRSTQVASPANDRQLAELRRVTAPFNRFAAAVDAGWSHQLTPCFSSSEGGMGFHYAKTSLLDGTVNAAQPEALLYEPQRDGSLRFVGVEYIVPRTAWSGAEPPVLYGQTFPYIEAFDVYGLHVWVGTANPDGVFAAWNPRVSCAYADRVK
jgi:hypothetical protein